MENELLLEGTAPSLPPGKKEEDCDYKFENKEEKQEAIYLMQRVYLELAKLVFLPFLYGFDLSFVIN